MRSENSASAREKGREQRAERREMGSVGEARCWHHWRNGESTSSVQGHKLPTPLCSYKIQYGKAFPDHVYKLHLDFWRLRSSVRGALCEMNCGERRGKRAEREERRGKKAEIMREERREPGGERREKREQIRQQIDERAQRIWKRQGRCSRIL